jgi:hypothetical protein
VRRQALPIGVLKLRSGVVEIGSTDWNVSEPAGSFSGGGETWKEQPIGTGGFTLSEGRSDWKIGAGRLTCWNRTERKQEEVRERSD